MMQRLHGFTMPACGDELPSCMPPAHGVGVVQVVVLWHSEQSPVFWLAGFGADTWVGGRPCKLSAAPG